MDTHPNDIETALERIIELATFITFRDPNGFFRILQALQCVWRAHAEIAQDAPEGLKENLH